MFEENLFVIVSGGVIIFFGIASLCLKGEQTSKSYLGHLIKPVYSFSFFIKVGEVFNRANYQL